MGHGTAVGPAIRRPPSRGGMIRTRNHGAALTTHQVGSGRFPFASKPRSCLIRTSFSPLNRLAAEAHPVRASADKRSLRSSSAVSPRFVGHDGGEDRSPGP